MANSILPPVIIEVIATVSGLIVSIGVPLILSKLNKIDKLHTTVFGLQEVSTVGGLVDDVNGMEERIDSIQGTTDTLKQRVKELEEELREIAEQFDEIERRQELILDKLDEMSGEGHTETQD